MKITILCVGKIKEKFYREAIEEYGKRLGRYCRFEIIEVADEQTPDKAGEALQEQMLLLGYEIENDGATLRYDGNHTAVTGEVTLDSHGDHRMAMALSLASTRHASITIVDAQVVAKSYPRWWEHLACAGFEI